MRHAARATGRRMAWHGPLEVVVQDDGAALLSWDGEAFASAAWDGVRLQRFQPLRVLGVPGPVLRAAIESAEALLAVAVGEEAPRQLMTWSPLEEVADLLYAVAAAVPPSRAARAAMREAIWALAGPTPGAGVIVALDAGAADGGPGGELLAAVLEAVKEVLAAAVSTPWFLPPRSGAPSRLRRRQRPTKKYPRKKKPKVFRIRHRETWF